MKYIIRKVEYITGNDRVVCRPNLMTDSIEKTRRELHKQVKCDKILFIYEAMDR